MTEIKKMIDMMGDRRVITRQMNITEYNYYLTGEIREFEDYLDLFEVLKNANSNDLVRIYIDTIGGSVAIGTMIINHIREAQEKDVVVLGNIGFTCASMGSAIALSCTDLELNPYSTMMVHAWQGGMYGAAECLHKEAEFNKKESEKYLRLIYSGFLEESEILRLLEFPIDLNFSAEEIDERFGNMMKYYENKYKQENETPVVEEPTPKKKPTKKTK